MNTISKVMKSTSAKAIGFLIAVMMLGGALTANAALTESQITAILGLLSSFGADQSVIDNVDASLRGTAPVATAPTSAACPYTWTSNLEEGSTGTDVLKLQQFLNGSADTQIAASGVGSPGSETNFFGSLTGAAVAKFQMKYASEVLAPIGLTSGTPFFYTMTRAKANSLCTTAAVVTPTDGAPVVVPAGTGLSVSAAVQPANSLAPQNASRLPFTRINLTAGNDGPVIVNSIVVVRGGLGSDAAFDGIVLLDSDGTQIGISKVLNSNHQVTLSEAFTIPAGTTKTVTIAANMGGSLGNQAGEVPSLSVIAINTSATLSGALPITGASHTINATLALGSATVEISSFDPNSSATKEIGTTGYKFSGIRLTAGSAEDIRLQSIRFNQTGSVSASDIANPIVVIDGISYNAAVSADGNFYSAMILGGLLIEKGLSKDIYIKADIIGANAAGRNAVFDIDESTDIHITGELYGYGITVTAPVVSGASDLTSQFTAGTPFFDGSLVTIQAGTATNIGKSNDVPAQNIAVNVPNQPLGGFETEFKGEAVTVQRLILTAATSSGSGSGLLTNVSIVDQNGAVVAGPVDATYTSANVSTLTFTDSITFPVGKMVYTLKGKVHRDIGNGTVYTLSTTPSDTAQWVTVKGDTTGNTITLAQGAFSMNQMTVKAAALAISVSPNPAAQSITAGTQGFTYANYQFDASQSGEDIRFAAIPLQATSSVGTHNQLSNCKLYDGSTVLNTGSNVINPSSTGTGILSQTFVLDTSLIIAKGTVKTLALKCDLATSVANGDLFAWGIASSPTITVTGLTSSNDVGETVVGNEGQTMTVAAGTIVVSKDASSPSYRVASAGSTGVVAGVMKFRAANEAVTLERIGLTLTSGAAADLVAVSIWDGATQVGSAVFTGVNTNATSTLSSVVILPKDTDKALTIKVDLAMVGTAQIGTQGQLITVNVDTNSDNTRGVGGAGNISASGSTSFAGVRMFKSFPTFAQDTLPGNGVADGRLIRFTVTADAAGSISLSEFNLTLSTTSADVTNVNIYGFTDAAYSSPVSGITANGQLSSANIAPASGGAVQVFVQTTGGGDTSIEIPAGGTRYFEVRSTVTGTDTTYSVTSTLKGDGSFNGLAASGSVTGNFVWSANELGTSATTTSDWSNGFGLLGLPSSGIISTRSN